VDSAKRCRDQSAECLSLMRVAQSETEARVLKGTQLDPDRQSDRTILGPQLFRPALRGHFF
jgi:hypothetical protein